MALCCPRARFTRIESFGSVFVDRIKVSVDPAGAQLLSIRIGFEINGAR